MGATERKPAAGTWIAAVLGLTILALGPVLALNVARAQEVPAQPAPVEPVKPPEPAPAPPAAEPAKPAEPAPAPAIPVPAPGTPISLNFKDASLRTVLEYLSGAAGLIVVEDAKVEGRVTVMSLQNISVDEAVSLLDTVLKQKGYAAIRAGRTLKIVTLDQAKRELVPVRTGNDPEKIQPTDRIVTHIIPIRYADAVKLKADISSLIPTSTDVASNAASNTLIVTGTEATVRRIVEIIQAIDVHMSDVSQVKVFTLKYANATSAAKLITDIFKPEQTAQGITLPFGGGRRTFMLPGGAPPAGGSEDTGQRTTKVTASADDRTNTLVVSAAPDVMKVIEGVVKDLDANPAEEQAVFIYRLKNAKAKNLESILNGVFGQTGTSPTGTAAAQRTTGGAFGGTSGTTGGAFGGRTGGSGTRGLGSSSTGTGRTGGTGTTRTTTSRPAGRVLSSAANAAASDLAGQVYVVADEDTNSIVVTSASKNFERIKAIILDLDRAVPQVLIKVLIAEVTHDKSIDLGVEFSLMNIRASGRGVRGGTDFSVASQTGGFAFKLEEKDVTAAVRALATTAKLDVLSRPYILTSDNQQASIMVGQTVPFITNTRTTDTGQTINTIEYDDIGIILNVTPHINPDGLVTMDVYPEISTLTGQTVPISETVNAPVFAKRSAQSRVAIRDGQTIVIGGLMEDRNTTSVQKVPILGDIPLLGFLFRRTIEDKTKTELLIFLTPHVAEQPEDLKSMSESEKAGAKVIQDAVEKGAFEEHLKGMERGAAPAQPPAEKEIPAPPAREPAPPTKQPPAPAP